MKIITSINAKGGCGKSTVASNLAAGLARRGHRTLLLDLDPQAQITEWFHLGDQFSVLGSITAVFTSQQTFAEVIQRSHLPNLDFVASSAPLEELGQQLRMHDGYEQLLAHFFEHLPDDPNAPPPYDYVVVDSPNQVSPVMDNAIFTTDLFVIPFLDTSSVRSFPNVYKQIHEIRDDDDYEVLHLLTNLSRMPGKRQAVLHMLEEFGIEPARTELRHCAYLGQTDTQGGSIFEYMPKSNGAADIEALVDEVITTVHPSDEPVIEAGVGFNDGFVDTRETPEVRSSVLAGEGTEIESHAEPHEDTDEELAALRKAS